MGVLSPHDIKPSLDISATRLGLVTLTCVLAAGVPYLDLFISLLGALVMAALELVFPVLVYTAVNWSSISWPSLVKVKPPIISPLTSDCKISL